MNAYEVFEGSDADDTVELYRHLETFGPIGIIALNLFRACKCSTRAKRYRRKAHSAEAYGRKQWSMDNLCTALMKHALTLGFSWGWKEDPGQEFHSQVLYVDLPTGQVSFHTERRGLGPEYPGEWDRVQNASAQRICLWVQRLLQQYENTTAPNPSPVPGAEAADDVQQTDQIRMVPGNNLAGTPATDLRA